MYRCDVCKERNEVEQHVLWQMDSRMDERTDGRCMRVCSERIVSLIYQKGKKMLRRQ